MNDQSYWSRIEYDPAVPGLEMDRHIGWCHLCKAAGGERALKLAITYCRVCKHWFCRDHRSEVFSRGIEAVRELIKGRRDGCCGPVEGR